MTPRRLVGLVLLSLTLWVGGARADETSDAAQLAFDEGKELMEKESYAEACPKFARSFELEAAIGTQFMLAECYEKLGRVASAWRNYIAVADTAARVNQRDREKFARERAEAVRGRVPTVELRVDASTVGGAELELKHNDEVLDSGLIGTPIPVDPGHQRFELHSAKHRPWSGEIDTAADGQAHVIDVKLELLPESPSGVGNGPAPRPGRDAVESGGLGALGIAGLVVGAAGVVGMGVGVGLGVSAKGSYDDALAQHCQGLECDPEGVDAVDAAQSRGTIGTVVFGVGAGVTAVGLALVLVDVLGGGSDDGSSDSATVIVAPSPEGLVFGVGGAF